MNAAIDFHKLIRAWQALQSAAPGYVRSAIAGRPETGTAADPSSFEPVAPFVAVETGAVGADRQSAIAAREGDVTGPEAPARKGSSTTTSRPHGLKDLDDPTLPSNKALKEGLKSNFEDS